MKNIKYSIFGKNIKIIDAYSNVIPSLIGNSFSLSVMSALKCNRYRCGPGPPKKVGLRFKAH